MIGISKKNAITSPSGFLANAVCAGIKNRKKNDLALLYSEKPAIAVGFFTKNRVKAAPVILSQRHLKKNLAQAIIANSGNANCCLGKSGFDAAVAMAEEIGTRLNLDPHHVLVASTGVIGRPFPINVIRDAMPSLVSGLAARNGHELAKAIMTTDTSPKEASVRVKIGPKAVTIGGVAKGAGMIHPNLDTKTLHATMLVFLTTDVNIKTGLLRKALGEAIEDSFNSISIDGDTSTNDTVFILANGLAGNKVIDSEGSDYKAFSSGLSRLTKELAKMIVRDGEGATKFVEIQVAGAPRKETAKFIASKIATSNLFKTCIYGADPNWGRIASAVGASGTNFNADRLDIYIGGRLVMRNGVSANMDRNILRKIFEKKDINIKVDLKGGKHSAVFWTCDLTEEYVRINAEYST